MKFGRVLRDDDALAEPMIGEPRHAVDDGGIGVRRRDDFEQPQVARRVEEVRARASAAGNPSLRPSASAAIGMPDVFDDDDRAGAAHRVDAFEQRALDVELLDDRLDDPVGVGERGEVACRSRRSSISDAVSAREERIRLERARALQPLARDVAGQVEQQHRNAGIGEVRGDLRAHRARRRARRRIESASCDCRHRGGAPLQEQIDDRVGVGLERVACAC